MESATSLDAVDWNVEKVDDEQARLSDPSDPRFEFIQMKSETVLSTAQPKLFARLRVLR